MNDEEMCSCGDRESSKCPGQWEPGCDLGNNADHALQYVPLVNETSKDKKPMTDNQIEQEIQSKGLTAPRVTPSDIEANIVGEHYFTGADGVAGAFTNAQIAQGRGVFPDEIGTIRTGLKLLTFCVLELRNGFAVTGESACASPENFDAEVGRKIARANAVAKIWPLLGFALKQKLFESSK